jgi:hypothetical protein
MKRLLALLFVFGCAPVIHYTQNNSATMTPRGPNCEFDVLATPPSRPYTEVGIFDVEFHGGAMAIKSAEELKHEVGPKLCQVGADAVISQVNGVGFYVRAVAIRWTEQTTAQ